MVFVGERFGVFLFQKTVPGRVRVKFAQNGGHEKATKKPRKSHESASPGEQSSHPSPLIWPGHCEIWGCFFFFCGFFWAFLRRCGKRGSRPGRTQDRRESCQNPESRQVRNPSCNAGSQRPSPRRPATPAGPAQKRSQRSTTAWCPVRFGGCEEAKGGNEGDKMRKGTPPGGRIFAACQRRERSCRLRGESCKGGGLPHPFHHQHTPRGLQA